MCRATSRKFIGPGGGAPVPTSCNTMHAQTAQTKTCPEYKHFESAHTVNSPLGGYVVFNDCVDDIHVLTEAEWQHLQARLTFLEEQR